MSFPVPVKYKLTATLDNIVVEYSNGQEWEGLPSPPDGGGAEPTGTKTISITENGVYTEDVAEYADAEITVNVSGGGLTAAGSFTGDGSQQVTIPCSFEPDLIYWVIGGSAPASGTLAGIIARDMLALNEYRYSTNRYLVDYNITDMNTGGSSGNYKATYENGSVTLRCDNSDTRYHFANGSNYSYKFVKWTT